MFLEIANRFWSFWKINALPLSFIICKLSQELPPSLNYTFQRYKCVYVYRVGGGEEKETIKNKEEKDKQKEWERIKMLFGELQP